MDFSTFRAEDGEEKDAILLNNNAAGKAQVQWRPLVHSFGARMVELLPGGNPPQDDNSYTPNLFASGQVYNVRVTKLEGEHQAPSMGNSSGLVEGVFQVPKTATGDKTEQVRLLLGLHCPSLAECLALVNRQCTIELTKYVTVMHTMDDAIIPDETWDAFVADKSVISVQVVIFGPKAHTAVSESDAKMLLTGNALAEETIEEFGKSWLVSDKLCSDTVLTCCKFLSLHSRLSNPLSATKEMSRREFISPVLVASGILAGDLELLPEVEASCPETHGFNDWEYLLDAFPLAVIEAKLHQLDKHKGQLYSGMAASRHQYCVGIFGHMTDCKELVAEVPVCGILTNAAQYQIFKYDPRAKTNIIKSEVFDVPIKANMTASEAATALQDIIAVIVQLLLDQKQMYKAFWESRKRAPQPSSVSTRLKLKGAVQKRTAERTRKPYFAGN